ncbi:MAG: Gfo/Idh/MocA family oxidoreductase [Nocardioidaceae bacterium]|nr:Gfo/Idh/MocA family oxidoreductase [Nocardioidaceae bacterium]
MDPGRRDGGHRPLPADAGRRRHPARPAGRPEQGPLRPGPGRGAQADRAQRTGRHQGERRPVHRSRLRVLTSRSSPARAGRRRSTDRPAAPSHGQTGPLVIAQTPLGIGLVGHAFMGAAHSHAWRTAPYFFDLPLRPELRVLAGRDPERVAAAARRLGWAETETDWRRLVERDDVDLVDVCTPGDTHAEIAVAALEAGKHVLCEKPLANSVEEAARMAAAAERAQARGSRAMVGFTYRRVPAVALARQLVAEGRVGEIRHVRAQYLQDWIADADAPMSWRLQKERAGSGALGDIGAHIVDLTQHITGQSISTVTGLMETFVRQRPLADGHGASLLGGETASGNGSAPTGEVTVDDTATFLARFGGGAVGVFEATRFATGRKNAIRVEVNGTGGSLAFDFEDMNVLQFFDGDDPDRTAGFKRILVTESTHPWASAWWPPGHGLGYEHGFTHQVVDLVHALADGRSPQPSFADGLQVQCVLDAVERSAAEGTWYDVTVPDLHPLADATTAPTTRT